jgi:hypothetical protein
MTNYTTLTYDGITEGEPTRKWKLNHLIGILRKVGCGEEFNMGKWWNEREDLECGFAGCALGWAVSDPVFNKMGLHIRQSYISHAIGYDNGKGSYSVDYEAGAELFELSEEESDFLFCPDSYVTEDCPSEFYTVVHTLEGEDKINEFFLPVLEQGEEEPYYVWQENLLEYYKEITPGMVIKHIEFVRDNPYAFGG